MYNKQTLAKYFLALSGIIFLIFLAYIPGLSGPFIFDDLSNITNNNFLQLQSLSPSTLYSSATSGHAGPLKRPVAMLSFALNYFYAGGYDASAFKLTNIFIHSLNAILLLTLCLQLLKSTDSLTGNNHNKNTLFWLAAGISLIWAVHPINLTSVLYVVQRMTALSTLFSLGCIILYLRARKAQITSGFNNKTLFLFTLSLLSLTLALFSKENAALIPLIILWVELTLYPQQHPWARFKHLTRNTRWFIYALLIFTCIVGLIILIDYASASYHHRPFSMLERVLTEPRVLCFYLSLILLPRINSFGLFHDDILLSTSIFSPWTTLLAIIFISSLALSAIYYRKTQPLYALGIGWFFIGHLLESSFFALEIAHEHRNNFPSIGIILAIFALIPKSHLVPTKKTAAGFFAVVLILASSTYLRATQWSSYQRLAYYEAAHHPDSPAIQALLSNAANQVGDIETATQAIKKAMALEPKEIAYALHYQNILAIYKKAIPDNLQKETLKRIKNNPVTASAKLALHQIAACLHQPACEPLQSNYLEWIDQLIEQEPRNADYYYHRGRAHRALNNPLAALNDFQRAHELHHTFMQPLFEMVDILLRSGQLSAAEEIVTWLENSNQASTLKRDQEINQLKQFMSRLKEGTVRSSK
ncbi:MAG: hypothetical protein KBT50_00165 [Cycloclasticus sp.]|nr:hypothetical protein [Cycloclasticus sp.]MBQ0789003.1 hypothetical protein [Cycloclasticus sp.]